MDPTLSPYGATPGAPPAQNSQLAAVLRQLLGNQQNQPGGGTGGPSGAQPAAPGAAQQGGGQNQGTFGGAGNVIKGLFNPPPTSILGQGITGVKNLFQGPSTSASPSPMGTGLGTYEGNIPSPANLGGMGPTGVAGQAPGAPAPTAALAPPSVTGGAGNMGMDPSGGAANPFGMGANPASPDAMTQALMAQPGMTAGAVNPATLGGGASLSDMLML